MDDSESNAFFLGVDLCGLISCRITNENEEIIADEIMVKFISQVGNLDYAI